MLNLKPFCFYNWDTSFHISSMVVDLSANEFKCTILSNFLGGTKNAFR